MSASVLEERTHREVSEFLVREAELLDNRQFDDWLELLAEDVVYNVPIRVTRGKGEGSEFLGESAWLRENRKSLTMRIQRLKSPNAFSENPPSRTRHFVSNVRIESGGEENELEVRSNLLVYRTRGDSAHYDLFSGERRDVLRRAGTRWKLVRREILLDQSILGAQDLSIIL